MKWFLVVIFMSVPEPKATYEGEFNTMAECFVAWEAIDLGPYATCLQGP